jgi:hypothetical protein
MTCATSVIAISLLLHCYVDAVPAGPHDAAHAPTVDPTMNVPCHSRRKTPRLQAEALDLGLGMVAAPGHSNTTDRRCGLKERRASRPKETRRSQPQTPPARALHVDDMILAW